MKKLSNFLSLSWYILVKMIQILWFFTVGAVVFLVAIIAIQSVITGQDILNFFRK